MSRTVERSYSRSTDKGEYTVHRRIHVSDKGGFDTPYISFPDSRHEVWGWEELIALKEALEEFFENEEIPDNPGDDE